MISTSWSMPDSPGNSGWPSISSAITQPVDQTSISTCQRRNQRFRERFFTNLGGVVGRAEDELWCSVVSRADVRHIWLVLYEDLGAAEIAKLQNTGRRVQQEILGLDIPVADTLRVDVGEGAEELVDIELDFEYGHDGFHLVEVARRAVDGLGNEFEHEIEVDFILLWLTRLAARYAGGGAIADTYPLAVVVEEGLELHDVGVPDDAHDLQFSVL